MVFYIGNRVKCTNAGQTWDLCHNQEYTVVATEWNNAGNQIISLDSIPNRAYSSHRFVLVSNVNTNTKNSNTTSQLTFEDRFVEEMTTTVLEMLEYEGVSEPDQLPDITEWENLVNLCNNLGYRLEIESNPKVVLTKL